MEVSQWLTLVYTVMNLCVLWRAGVFFTIWATVSCSRKNLLWAVSYIKHCYSTKSSFKHPPQWCSSLSHKKCFYKDFNAMKVCTLKNIFVLVTQKFLYWITMPMYTHDHTQYHNLVKFHVLFLQNMWDLSFVSIFKLLLVHERKKIEDKSLV